MDTYGMPGGPVHDASVIAYLLKPELFKGRDIHMVVDSRGPDLWPDHRRLVRRAQTARQCLGGGGRRKGFFDLLSARLARLK
jgi:purine nucleosidase